METFSALLAICAGNSPVPGEFPAQRPVTRSFDVFFDLRLNKRLSKQSWGWWFETLPCPLWRHRNEPWLWRVVYSNRYRGFCYQYRVIVASLNTLRPRYNGSHHAEDLLKYIFVNAHHCILIQLPSKPVPECPIRTRNHWSDNGLVPNRHHLLMYICATPAVLLG